MTRRLGVRTGPLSVLTAVLLIAGCVGVPTGRFDSLATATNEVQTSTAATYDRVEKLQRTYMIFNPADGPYTERSFDPVIDGRSFDLDPRLRFRESVLDVVARYVETLQTFAKTDFQEDLDTATTNLNASLSSLTKQVGGSADATKAAGILAAAVNGIGRVVIEHKRRQALQGAMGQAQPGLDEIARLFDADTALIEQAVVVMRGGILRTANTMRTATGNVDRVALNQQVAVVIAESRDIQASLQATKTAVAVIPKAHAEIRTSLTTETSLAQLQALVAEAKRLNGFYRSLK